MNISLTFDYFLFDCELQCCGQYASKKCSLKVHTAGICIEELSQMELQTGIRHIEKMIPIISSLTSPIINTAYNMQNEIGDINLKQMSASNDGLWMIQMCIDAYTSDFHCEEECVYKLLQVPNQVQSTYSFNLISC